MKFSGGHLILSVVIFLFSVNLYASDPWWGTRVQNRSHEMVVTHHTEANKVGYEILHRGGSAFDAFIAATMVEYVMTEGFTTAAGPLQAILYDAKSDKKIFLDGFWNSVRDPAGRWTTTKSPDGKAILVPGAIRALEALSRKYGRLTFAECLRPAYEIAREGFKINPVFASILKKRKVFLSDSNFKIEDSPVIKTQYGRETFFRNGKPLKEGDLLKLPEVENFIAHLMNEGADYMYEGDWAKQYVKTVRSLGGKMVLDDLKNYRAEWIEPYKIKYRGYEVFGPAGQNEIGPWTLIALKMFEARLIEIDPSVHFSRNAEDLTALLEVADDATIAIKNLENARFADRSFINQYFTKKFADHSANFNRLVRFRIQDFIDLFTAPKSTHSYSIAIVDREGNAITGVHSINAFPYADGYFVQGVSLSNAGKGLPSRNYGNPGERMLSPMSMNLVFENKMLRFLSSSFSANMVRAQLQFLVNLMDYKATAKRAVDLPRFGYRSVDGDTVQISPRFCKSVLKDVNISGEFQQEPKKIYDMGYGTVIEVRSDGSMQGARADLGKK
jgi:gamma-glutamyltranspeptidase/glutathione hydrolase